MFSLIPTAVYSNVYHYVSPLDLVQCALVSNEQSVCVSSYLRTHPVCPLCCNDWVSSNDIRGHRSFEDLDDNLNDDDIERRLAYMSSFVRAHILCDACESIVWNRRLVLEGQRLTLTDYYPFFEISSEVEVHIPDKTELLRLYYMTQNTTRGDYHVQLCLNDIPWVVMYQWKDGTTFWNSLPFDL